MIDLPNLSRWEDTEPIAAVNVVCLTTGARIFWIDSEGMQRAPRWRGCDHKAHDVTDEQVAAAFVRYRNDKAHKRVKLKVPPKDTPES